jgi:hypothetical protein
MVAALPMESYVDFFERELGIAEPGKTRVGFMPLDVERKMGVAVQLPDGRRHAVSVRFEPGWETLALEGLRDWKDNP